MRRALVIAAIAATLLPPPAASAEEIPVHVHEQDGLTVRLMPGPCVERNSTLMIASGAPQYLERLRALESVWRMKDGTSKPFSGCWLALSKSETGSEDVFVLLFEDGERYVVPKSEFLGAKRKSGA